MPQPTISGVPPTLKFGNAALPNGQGTMTQINLNDGTQWQWQAYAGDDDYVQIAVGQLAWRAASTILGRDRKARILPLPMRYQEASTAPSAALGVQTALMEQAGLQQLTFDNSPHPDSLPGVLQPSFEHLGPAPPSFPATIEGDCSCSWI